MGCSCPCRRTIGSSPVAVVDAAVDAVGGVPEVAVVGVGAAVDALVPLLLFPPFDFFISCRVRISSALSLPTRRREKGKSATPISYSSTTARHDVIGAGNETKVTRRDRDGKPQVTRRDETRDGLVLHGSR